MQKWHGSRWLIGSMKISSCIGAQILAVDIQNYYHGLATVVAVLYKQTVVSKINITLERKLKTH